MTPREQSAPEATWDAYQEARRAAKRSYKLGDLGNAVHALRAALVAAALLPEDGKDQRRRSEVFRVLLETFAGWEALGEEQRRGLLRDFEVLGHSFCDEPPTRLKCLLALFDQSAAVATEDGRRLLTDMEGLVLAPESDFHRLPWLAKLSARWARLDRAEGLRRFEGLFGAAIGMPPRMPHGVAARFSLFYCLGDEWIGIDPERAMRCYAEVAGLIWTLDDSSKLWELLGLLARTSRGHVPDASRASVVAACAYAAQYLEPGFRAEARAGFAPYLAILPPDAAARVRERLDRALSGPFVHGPAGGLEAFGGPESA